MELDLSPKLAKKVYGGDGGSYCSWSPSELPMFQEGNIGAAMNDSYHRIHGEVLSFRFILGSQLIAELKFLHHRLTSRRSHH